MGWPALQPKALANWGMFESGPLLAPAGERVRVAGDLLTFGFGRPLSGPDLCPSEEETLLGREPVDVGRTRLALKRTLVGVVRDGQAGEVANILTQGELAVRNRPGCTSYESNCLTTQAVRSSKRFLSSGVHHILRLPSASKRLP